MTIYLEFCICFLNELCLSRVDQITSQLHFRIYIIFRTKKMNFRMLTFVACLSYLSIANAWNNQIQSKTWRKPTTSISLEKTLSVKSSTISNFVTPTNDDSTRRNFLLVATSSVLATSAAVGKNPFIETKKESSSTLTQESMGIIEAVKWIDQNCDRRFLHAMVSSDYQFLYRGINELNPITRVRSEKPDLLSSETDYYTSFDAKRYFEKIESLLLEEPVKASNGHLATTSVKDASQYGIPASIWPLQGAHYAWFQRGGLFYPREGIISRNDIIVDGKDCGKDSLEDTLQFDSCEVMFSSPNHSFLAVPASLDSQLREALKSSFLI